MPADPRRKSHTCAVHGDTTHFVTFDLTGAVPDPGNRTYCMACLTEAMYQILDQTDVPQALRLPE